MRLQSFLSAQLLVFILTLGVVIALLWGLHKAASRIGMAHTARRQLLSYTGLGILLWLSILTELSRMGLLLNATSIPVLAWVFIPVLVMGLWLARSPTFGLLLRFVGPAWLVWIHTFRAFLALTFYLSWRAGLLPVHLSVQGLNQDFIVGITAPMAGLLFFNRRFYLLQALLWHLFGLLLAAAVLLLIVWSTPSAHAAFAQTTTLFTEFPFVWIPGFLLPLAMVLHGWALWQLKLFWKK